MKTAQHSAAYVQSQSYRRKVAHPDSKRTRTAREKSLTRRAVREMMEKLGSRF